MEKEGELSFGEFKVKIFEYESDTFSAEGSEITADETETVARKILYSFAENNLDGVLINNLLTEIRAENEKEEE